MRLISKIHIKIKFIQDKIIFAKRNKHNSVTLVHDVDPMAITIGDGTYGPLYVIRSNDNANLYIGNYCSIAENVTFILDGDHPINTVSSFPFKKKIMHHKMGESITKGDIVVEDDVWICYGATILSGVKIGKGAVVGCNCLVTKDVPAYAVVGGVPAQVLKYRFDPTVIEKLKRIDLKEVDIKKNINLLYEPVNDSNIDYIYEELTK